MEADGVEGLHPIEVDEKCREILRAVHKEMDSSAGIMQFVDDFQFAERHAPQSRLVTML
jgi:hypothetical protein